jgi:SAM-dependent methyltransferase
MSNVWDARADAYRTSVTHASGEDLDAVVELCDAREGVRILDVATGGGHVARRLRERGAEVVTTDASPGMKPDVVARAEALPFVDGSFDVVVSRIAAHHFGDVAKAVAEMARVSRDVVVIEDMLYRSADEEQAEKLRDPSHVHSLTEEEWRDMVARAGLETEQTRRFTKTHEFDDWLARTGCDGDEAARVRELLAPVSSADGKAWSNEYVVLQARKRQSR